MPRVLLVGHHLISTRLNVNLARQLFIADGSCDSHLYCTKPKIERSCDRPSINAVVPH
jgi:hypothetical protein